MKKIHKAILGRKIYIHSTVSTGYKQRKTQNKSICSPVMKNKHSPMLCFWAASPVGLWEDRKRSLPLPDSHTCQVLDYSDACIPLPQKSAGWQCDPSLWYHRWRVLLPQSWQNSHPLRSAPDLAVQSYLKEWNVKGHCWLKYSNAWHEVAQPARPGTCVEAAIRLFNNICPALINP